MIVTNTRGLGATGYAPNCSGTYNPCGEIQKAKANGIAVTASLIAKCKQYGQACFPGSGDYVPDCTGAYSPAAEVNKAYATGLTPSASILAKSRLWAKTCGQQGTMPPAPAARAGAVATMPTLRQFMPQAVPPPAMPNYGAQPYPTMGPDGTIVPTATPAVTSTDAMTWLSENKGTVGLGLAVLVGAIVLVKLL